MKRTMIKQQSVLNLITLIHYIKNGPLAVAFFTTHHGNYHRQSTHRLNLLIVNAEKKKTTINASLIINRRPLVDITTANIHNLHKSELNTPSSFSSKQQEQQYIQVEGYIIKYRSYGSSLAFLDVIQSDLKNETAEILLKRDTYNQFTLGQESLSDLGKSPFSALIQSLKPGLKISIVGTTSTTHNPGEIVFLARNIKILRLPQDPQYIKGILQRIHVPTHDDDQKDIFQQSNGTHTHEDELNNRGLDIDEIAQCIPVNSTKLRKTLLGEINSLFQNHQQIDSTTHTLHFSPSMNNVYMNSNVDKWNRLRIVYASIANEICSNMVQEDEYPEIFLKKLHAKKSKKGSIQTLDRNVNATTPSFVQSHNYRDTMPMAPSEYVQTSMKILSSSMDRFNTSKEIWIDNSVTPVSIQELLNHSIGQSYHIGENNTRIVQTSGWVLNRKQFRDSICILWITDDSSLNPNDIESKKSNRIKCILDRKIMEQYYAIDHGIQSDATLNPFDLYSYIASSGTKLDIRGYYIQNFETESPVLWVTDILLRRCSWSPQSINFLLSFLSRPSIHDNDDDDNALYPLSIEEIQSAFDLSSEMEVNQLIQFCRENDATARQWRAAEISKKLQEINTRPKMMSSEMVELLDSYESLRMSWPVEHVMLNDGNIQTSSYTKKRSAGSRWERNKRPQLEWMTGELLQLVKSHPAFGKRPLNIIDIDGGRGHLANQISSVLGASVIIHVIDIDSRVVKNGMMRSKRNMLQVQYAVGDASDSSFLADQWGSHQCNVDIVVALHACGTLSDVALAFASSHSASFVIVPCCFRSNSHLLVNIQQKDSQVQSMLQE